MSTYLLAELLVVAFACIIILAFELDTLLDEWIKRRYDR